MEALRISHLLVAASIIASSGCGMGSAANIGTPSLYQSPRMRWWWPGGWVDQDEIARELTEMASAGFGGGEIGDVWNSVTAPLDPTIYGWSGDRWNDGILSAFKTGNELVHTNPLV
jgi:hypothetical protein